MNEEECLTADWYGIGYEDGAMGRGAAFIGNRREACAKHGVTPDLEAYNEGRVSGLDTYCVPARGFTVGRSGGAYEGVCQGRAEDDFLMGYRAGQDLGNIERELGEVKAELDSAKNTIEDRAKRLEEARRKILFFDDKTPIEDRQKLLDDMERWEQELRQANADIEPLQGELVALELEVEAARRSSPFL